MTIPFTQYLLPNGRKRDAEINRPAEVEEIAQRFIASGGRYECEVLRTGHVSLTAVKNDDDVEIVVCANGPGVGEKVDELVRKSAAHVAG
jgi:hypothetical protein